MTDGARLSPTVFVEALGLGGYGSINLDLALEGRSIADPHLRVGFWDDRITISKFNPDALITIPVEVGLLVGKTHRVEVNLGYTFELPTEDNTHKDVHDEFTSIVGWFGYRYQRKEGGFFAKIGLSVPFTSTETSNDGTVHVESTAQWRMALGLGYTFK